MERAASSSSAYVHTAIMERAASSSSSSSFVFVLHPRTTSSSSLAQLCLDSKVPEAVVCSSEGAPRSGQVPVPPSLDRSRAGRSSRLTSSASRKAWPLLPPTPLLRGFSGEGGERETPCRTMLCAETLQLGRSWRVSFPHAAEMICLTLPSIEKQQLGQHLMAAEEPLWRSGGESSLPSSEPKSLPQLRPLAADQENVAQDIQLLDSLSVCFTSSLFGLLWTSIMATTGRWSLVCLSSINEVYSQSCATTLGMALYKTRSHQAGKRFVSNSSVPILYL
mmetsp:Transcript_64967/g.174654  ORF Transcript_64967/g.174654 Transcript_64967/m.174654 type:complete len:278 (+) Transcript_64967:156-989(+)